MVLTTSSLSFPRLCDTACNPKKVGRIMGINGKATTIIKQLRTHFALEERDGWGEKKRQTLTSTEMSPDWIIKYNPPIYSMSVGYGMVISELMNPTGSSHNKPRPIWLYLLLFLSLFDHIRSIISLFFVPVTIMQ